MSAVAPAHRPWGGIEQQYRRAGLASFNCCAEAGIAATDDGDIAAAPELFTHINCVGQNS
jgi:hypothetical protein